MILYRPVGLAELELIAASGFRSFPPRLPEQPIFYPVLNFDYAEQIARDWNTKSAPYAGFVTKFEVDDDYISKFPIQTVGTRVHQELWVPAVELEEFNRQITDRIEVVASYYGAEFSGEVDDNCQLPKHIARMRPESFLVTVNVIVDRQIHYDSDDPYVEVDKFSDRLIEAVEAFVATQSGSQRWESSSCVTLGLRGSNSGQCAICGRWVTDQEKPEPIYGLNPGATVDGQLLCDEHLPKDHRWAF